ncbi:MAG: glycosyltransferase family 2 protein [Boseongicola sp.]|nr:glycosyltransferase family 2 protein [Boseongicola sp.]MDD9978572.1 glycosyltransferase family 2 protein [Boseongicola sp.]
MPPPVSVVVVSQNRPTWLSRCLTSLSQLAYPNFEIVVVADAAGLAAVARHPLADDIHAIEFNEANISAARNTALGQCAGEIVAFVDDDAVAEPMWLSHLVEGFMETDAAGVVGFVRGRNGISFQSRVCSVDAEAETHEEPPGNDSPFVPHLRNGRALKLVGTNCGFRRDILCQLGGFDPTFSFFLEDSDASMRLAKAGHILAVAPLAEVHHSFAESVRRTPHRRPRRLFDIGRSTAAYVRRYEFANQDEIRERIFRREFMRLEQHLATGTAEPRDLPKLMKDLEAGWVEGLSLNLLNPSPIEPRKSPFKPIKLMKKSHKIESARLLGRKQARRQAEEWARSGHPASVFSFSLTPVRHHVRYLDSGVWVQTGGQFGRSDRNDRLFRWCRFADRVRDEIRRVEKQRGIVET